MNRLGSFLEEVEGGNIRIQADLFWTLRVGKHLQSERRGDPSGLIQLPREK